MKRRISLVIALVPSFLMMFGSIAKAEGTKVQTSECTSKLTKIEVVKVPPVERNKANFPPPQVKAIEQILQQREQTSKQETNDRPWKPLLLAACGECDSGGARGRWTPLTMVKIGNEEMMVSSCKAC
ncbi:hypothetical protein SD81_001935 [Tolypothrix campylonemoides VB511288]|nr:hypothetical protein SD81_001935 [Tolypothrix campylonemoides VB511288]